MKAYILKVWQPDCPVVNTSEKFLGDHVKVFVINSKIKNNHVEALIKISSDSTLATHKFINKLSNCPNVSMFQVLGRKDPEVLGLLVTREVTNAMKTLEDVTVYYFPFIAYDGIEKWFVVSKTGKSRVLEALSKGGNEAQVETSLSYEEFEHLLRGGVTTLYIASEDLKKVLKVTERQFKAASLALERGYYNHPRKVGLNTLSKELQISKTAYAKLLRKVERRALSLYLCFIKCKSLRL